LYTNRNNFKKIVIKVLTFGNEWSIISVGKELKEKGVIKVEFDVMRLKAERIAKGLTQEDVANALGVTRSWYAMKENGRRNITMEEFSKILDVLGYDSSYVHIFFKLNVAKRER